jgi:hypothetical protein
LALAAQDQQQGHREITQFFLLLPQLEVVVVARAI